MRSINKKGDFPSLLFGIIVLFIIGIFIFFMNHMTNQVWDSFDGYFNSTTDYNDSEARDAVQGIQTVENSLYDYITLAILIGITIQLLLFSYATRISVIFYWLYGIMSIGVVILGVILSNIWQTAAANPEFATTITRFPITNTILGNYYPTIVVAIIFLVMIILFGKTPGSAQ